MVAEKQGPVSPAALGAGQSTIHTKYLASHKHAALAQQVLQCVCNVQRRAETLERGHLLSELQRVGFVSNVLGQTIRNLWVIWMILPCGRCPASYQARCNAVYANFVARVAGRSPKRQANDPPLCCSQRIVRRYAYPCTCGADKDYAPTTVPPHHCAHCGAQDVEARHEIDLQNVEKFIVSGCQCAPCQIAHAIGDSIDAAMLLGNTLKRVCNGTAVQDIAHHPVVCLHLCQPVFIATNRDNHAV